jgi:hypothetical protein
MAPNCVRKRVTLEGDCLNREEVAGEYSGGLLMQELSPTRVRAPRRRPRFVGAGEPALQARHDQPAQHPASLLPSEHGQLMPQDEQLDVLGELTAPAGDQ